MKCSVPWICLVLLTAVPTRAQTAVEYLGAIGQEFEKIAQDMMSYTSAVHHGKSARKIDKRRTELVTQVKSSEATVRRMKPFNGSTILRDSISAYFRISYHILTEDYEKILNLEEIAEQSYDAMEAYMLANELADEKRNASYRAATTEYRNFAKANDIRLIESESKLSQKLDVAAEVSKYDDKLYLLFFKSYKNETYLIDAMSRGDVAAMEQTRNALLTSATEDLEKVKPIAAFKGDNVLKQANQQVLLFYKSEAVDKAPQIIDFYLKKEEFEKMQKAMEAKRNKTNAEVTSYNKAVIDYNQRSTAVNKLNDELNRKRSTLLRSLNEARQAFLDKYTPKYK
jgi:hypothetical protein